MYSYEDRLKAVKLYIQYDKSYASVFRELGYHTVFLHECSHAVRAASIIEEFHRSGAPRRDGWAKTP
jgi:transposase-like protein